MTAGPVNQFHMMWHVLSTLLCYVDTFYVMGAVHKCTCSSVHRYEVSLNAALGIIG